MCNSPSRLRSEHFRRGPSCRQSREREFCVGSARLSGSDRKNCALVESMDTGKPVSAALSLDIPRSALNFEFFADAITQFSSECHTTDRTALNYTLRTPLGVVACISPWNLPLYLLTWKVAPALAAGNTSSPSRRSSRQ